MRMGQDYFLAVPAAMLAASVCCAGDAPSIRQTIVDATRELKVETVAPALFAAQTKPAKPTTVTVQTGVSSWSIDSAIGRQTVHLTDFTLFHVRAGRITVLIDGKEETKKADDFWTAPRGATLTLQAKGETAMLELTTMAAK